MTYIKIESDGGMITIIPEEDVTRISITEYKGRKKLLICRADNKIDLTLERVTKVKHEQSNQLYENTLPKALGILKETQQ